MKVSLIIPSYLGEYKNCASHRKMKLQRALICATAQARPHNYLEIIVVADGCDETVEVVDIFKKDFGYPGSLQNTENLSCIKIPKQPLFSGNVRQAGLDKATGDIICYLDSDDTLETNHIQDIVDGFNLNRYDWIYFNDYVRLRLKDKAMTRYTSVGFGNIGTSAIAHKNKPEFSWKGCDGYNHDWAFIQRLKHFSKNYTKIEGTGYVVCHIPNNTDF